MIPSLRIDRRALFVVDKSGAIRRAEDVKEVAEHPNCGAGLAALRALGQ